MKNDNMPYIAIDGSEHADMHGVWEANERYWNSIYIETKDENQEVLFSDEDKKVIKEYYKSLYKNLNNNILKYTEWENIYDRFVISINAGILNKEFIKDFANLLLVARVMRLSDGQEKSYQTKKNHLNGLVERLSNTDNLKR